MTKTGQVGPVKIRRKTSWSAGSVARADLSDQLLQRGTLSAVNEQINPNAPTFLSHTQTNTRRRTHRDTNT